MFRDLVRLLNTIHLRSNENKMTSYNLATVFGPCILYPKDKGDPIKLASEMSQVATVLQFIIDYQEKIFPNKWPEENNLALSEEDAPPPVLEKTNQCRSSPALSVRSNSLRQISKSGVSNLSNSEHSSVAQSHSPSTPKTLSTSSPTVMPLNSISQLKRRSNSSLSLVKKQNTPQSSEASLPSPTRRESLNHSETEISPGRKNSLLNFPRDRANSMKEKKERMKDKKEKEKKKGSTESY